MSVISIIKEEVYKFNEEYNPGDKQLYGYHVTSKEKLESIFANGFTVGTRQMQGRGFYAFYDYSHAVRYLMKGEIQNPVMVKFVVTCKNCLLYLNTEIAKQVLGADYHLKLQLEQQFKYRGGLEFLLKEVQTVYDKNMTMEDLIQKLDYIEENNSEGNQSFFIFNMISTNTNDRLDLVWNGNYGLEYRVNYVRILDPIGYYDYTTTDRKYYQKPQKSIVPDTEDYKDLRLMLRDSNLLGTKSDLLELKYKLYDRLAQVRNNRDYDYFDNIINQIQNLI
jgi:hypothetical protein